MCPLYAAHVIAPQASCKKRSILKRVSSLRHGDFKPDKMPHACYLNSRQNTGCTELVIRDK